MENTLLAPEEIEYDVSGGSFNDTFKPGEIKIYKLLGDNLEIFEELNVPESSHQSGIYIGPQKISLTTGDNGAKIYYTTDGSFPEVNSALTANPKPIPSALSACVDRTSVGCWI